MEKYHTVRLKSCAGTAEVLIKEKNEHIQRVWMRRGIFYEAALLNYIYENFSGGTFIDCGSNIGNHTLFFAKFCSPDLVVSIEPVVESVELQKKILELNEIQNKVKILNLAISDSKRRGSMERYGTQKTDRTQNDGMYQLVEGDDIAVDTLDNIVSRENLKNVSMVKLDIESEELRALKGAKTLLTEQNPTIFFERYGIAEDNEKVESYLKVFGYKYKQLHKLSSPVFEFVKES